MKKKLLKKHPRISISKIKISNYKEVVYVIKILKQQKKIILNLESVEKMEKKRIIDFLSGFIYANDGFVRSINSQTYIFSLKK